MRHPSLVSPPRRLATTVAVSLLALLTTGAATANAQIPYRGVMLHSLWPSSTDQDMDRELDMAKDLGSSAVRVDVAWSSLETLGKGQYSGWYLAKLDRFVAGASARGIKVIANVYSTPCWASSAPATLKQSCSGAWWDRGVTIYPPTNPQDFANIVHFIVGRYGTQLAAVELWNEPNGSDHNFLYDNGDLPGEYTTLVKAGYPAAKSANPAVPVLAGALSFSDANFLQALYDDGMKGYYDGISVHPYNEWRAPSDLWQPQWKEYALIPGLQWLRATQLANGDTSPVWITEFGWTSCAPGGTDPWCVTAAQQAQYLHDAFPLIDQLGFIHSAIVYNLRDKGTDPTDREDNYGLVQQDYTLKPAYTAVKDALAGLPYGSSAASTAASVPSGAGATAGGWGQVTTTSARRPHKIVTHSKKRVRRGVLLALVRRGGRRYVAGLSNARRVLLRVYKVYHRRHHVVRKRVMKRWVKVRRNKTFVKALPRRLSHGHLLVKASVAGRGHAVVTG